MKVRDGMKIGKKRLTTTNFGKIVQAKSFETKIKLVRTLKANTFQTTAIKYGKEQENNANMKNRQQL